MLRCKSFYLNQNQVFKVNSVSGVVLDIKKTTNKFRKKKKKWKWRLLLWASLRWVCISVAPSVSPLVVALESLCHEQLPEVLRGEFLHILAVVVNLPCWSVTTCVHTPPYKRHKHAPTETYRQTRTHTHVHRRCTQPGGGGRENSSTAKQWISVESE